MDFTYLVILFFSDYAQYTHHGTRSVQDIIQECIKKAYGLEPINGPNVVRNKRQFETLLDESSTEFSTKEKRHFYQIANSMMMSKMLNEMQVFVKILGQNISIKTFGQNISIKTFGQKGSTVL